MGAAGHQIVAGAFRGGLGQHRGFDVHEAVLLQELAQRADDPGAQPQPLLHLRPAQIEIAIAQPHFLGGILVVQLERQRLGSVENLQLAGQHLHRPGSQVGILGTFGPPPHPSNYPQHVFVAHPLGVGEGIRCIGVDHDLYQTLAVAQVDEDHAAMIAAAMRPTAEGDILIQQGLGDLAAIVAAHGVGFPSYRAKFQGKREVRRVGMKRFQERECYEFRLPAATLTMAGK